MKLAQLYFINMNLVVDTGNTFIKMYLFENNKITHFQKFSTSDQNKCSEYLLKIQGVKNAIICSVAEITDEFFKTICQISNYRLILDHLTPIPVKNLYKTPETLGKDRLAAIVGAYTIYPNQNVLTIDAGTAITYDFINFRAEYIGGNISPGIGLRFKALNQNTKNLPLLQHSEEVSFLGSTTEEAIIAGVQRGIIYEMDAYIDDLERKNNNLKTILTGGDTFFFEHKLKNTIFAEPNLVAIGLNRILLYNVK